MSKAEAAFHQLPRRLREIGITASSAQLGQLRIHYELLLKWNQRINLTSIREPSEIIQRHFVESISLADRLAPQGGVLVDVGSGAGFPGIPLSVMRPGLRVVLVESNQKKAAFLKEVGRAIGSDPPLEVFAGRFEELRLQVNWITMRAVRPDRRMLDILIEALVPRGTLAILIGFDDASRLGPDWKVLPVPGSSRTAAAFHVKP